MDGSSVSGGLVPLCILASSSACSAPLPGSVFVSVASMVNPLGTILAGRPGHVKLAGMHIAYLANALAPAAGDAWNAAAARRMALRTPTLPVQHPVDPRSLPPD